MKFISKNSVYKLILKQGISGNRELGLQSTPGISVRFENHEVNVTDEKTIEMLLAHPSYNTEFTKAEEPGMTMPRKALTEPTHEITEMKYGHIEGTVGGRTPVDINSLATNLAVEMVKKLLGEDELKALLAKKSAKQPEQVAAPVKEDAATVAEKVVADSDETTPATMEEISSITDSASDFTNENGNVGEQNVSAVPKKRGRKPGSTVKKIEKVPVDQ